LKKEKASWSPPPWRFIPIVRYYCQIANWNLEKTWLLCLFLDFSEIPWKGKLEAFLRKVIWKKYICDLHQHFKCLTIHWLPTITKIHGLKKKLTRYFFGSFLQGLRRHNFKFVIHKISIDVLEVSTNLILPLLTLECGNGFSNSSFKQ